MTIFLTGATGFVGSHMLTRLLAEGHRLRCLVRPGAEGRLPRHAQVEATAGDIVAGTGLDEGMAGCQAVIHLVGIIMERRGASFEQVHYQGSRNVIAAARRQGVGRYVQMSALGARPDGVSAYQTTKFRAEQELRASGLPHVILRPSIIFGPGDGFVSQMADVMRKAPLLRPVPGHGRYPFRPIYIDNVVDCFVQSLTSSKALNRSIDLVGPDQLTLAEMLEEIARCIGVRKKAVKIPFPLMYANAAILGAILPRPPVTTDQLRMLREGSVSDPRPMQETFDVKPIGFREGLNRYLCRAASAGEQP